MSLLVRIIGFVVTDIVLALSLVQKILAPNQVWCVIYCVSLCFVGQCQTVNKEKGRKKSFTSQFIRCTRANKTIAV